MNKELIARIICIILVISMLFANFSVALANDIETAETENTTAIKVDGSEDFYEFKLSEGGIYAIEVKDSEGNRLAYEDYTFAIVGGKGETAYSPQRSKVVCGVPSDTTCQIELYGKEKQTYTIKIECLEKGENYEESFWSVYNDYNVEETGELANELGIEIQQIDEDESDFSKLESLAADFVIIIGKSINWTLSVALGKTLTMDDIVFNRYDEIRLDYFTYGIDGEKVESSSKMINALKNPIDKCYSLFGRITILGYVIILVYIGLRMLIDSTSVDKRTTGKVALFYWGLGVAIFFIYPFLMRYIILINDALVSDIGSKTQQHDSTYFVSDGDGLLADIEEKMEYTNSSNQDYMSILGYTAQETKSLGVAIAYLIITWQLVMMVIYYYKRTFMVGFLIMIFPFVALTYVIDKLNDGKSQALDGWTREFVFCVMVQIFHAIVYVFVVNTIYNTANSTNIDTILVMIAATFMFEGENIMKHIFGGDKTLAVGSPAQNTAMMSAIAGLGVKVAKGPVKNIGKSVLHGGKIAFDTVRPSSAGHRFDAFKNSVKENSDMYKNFKNLGNPIKQWQMINGGFGEIADRNMKNARMAQILPSAGNITQNINEVAEAIDLINNGTSVRDMAEGLDKLRELMKKKDSMTEQEKMQFNAMMRLCKISADQFTNIQNGVNTACIMAGRQENPKRINQHLKMTVEYSFSNLPETERKEMVGKVYAATMYNMRAGYVDKEFIEDKVKDDWNEQRETAYRFGKGAKFRGRKGSTADSTEVAEKMQKVARGYQRQLASQIKDYDSLSADEKKKIKSVGNAISYITMTEGSQPEKLKQHMEALSQDFGENQQVIRNFINSHINLNDLQKSIETGGTIRGVQLVATRTEGLKKQFTDKYGEKLPDNMTQEEFNNVIESVAKLEQLNSGEFSVVETGKAIQTLDRSGDVAEKLLKISNLDMKIDSLKYLIAQAMTEDSMSSVASTNKEYNQVMDWAKNTVNTMVNNEGSPTAKDPVTSIYDIINAAKYNGGASNIEELYVNSTPGSAINAKVDGVVDSTKKFASTILKDMIEDKNTTKQEKQFADKKEGGILQPIKNAWARTSDEYTSKTVNGYTYEEWIDMQGIYARESENESIKGIGETFLKPAAGFVGGIVGMALSNDGMPIGEAATGIVAGAGLVDAGMKDIMQESKLESKKKNIIDKVEKRLEKVEKDRLIPRGESSEDNIKKLKINLVSGNLYQNAEDEFHVTLKIIAENATYMSIGEINYIGPWMPYSEDFDYTLQNPNSRIVYIRLRDSSGNGANTQVTLY